MKKCPFNVSSRSYDKFVKRIESVIADEDARRRMIAAMQLYLAGYTDRCMEQLDDAERMAFEMLRFELDEAMRRSVRARDAARLPRRVVRCVRLRRHWRPTVCLTPLRAAVSMPKRWPSRLRHMRVRPDGSFRPGLSRLLRRRLTHR